MQRLVSAAISLVLTLSLACSTACAQTTLPSYPDSSEGLSRFFNDMLVATVARDQGRLLAMSQSLILPNSDAWFKKVFGKEKGAKLDATYKEETKNFGPALAVLFLRLRDPAQMKVTTVRVEAADDINAKAYQSIAMRIMENPVPLYSVALVKEGVADKIEIWSIVYHDGGFRVVGMMRGVYESPTTQGKPSVR